MHFCENPLDVLDYYPLVDDEGRFSEFSPVEATGEVKADDNKKFVTTKLKIGGKLGFSGFVNSSVYTPFGRVYVVDKHGNQVA